MQKWLRNRLDKKWNHNLASILENWRQKIKIGDFFGSNIFGARATPDRYPISREAFLDPSDSYFLFADFVDFYTHWTYILYMPIFSRIFLSNYWWQRSDIWSQASYSYPISWEAFFDQSDSYFLFDEERGYHKWALAHSSSCYFWEKKITCIRTFLKTEEQ